MSKVQFLKHSPPPPAPCSLGLNFSGLSSGMLLRKASYTEVVILFHQNIQTNVYFQVLTLHSIFVDDVV